MAKATTKTQSKTVAPKTSAIPAPKPKAAAPKAQAAKPKADDPVRVLTPFAEQLATEFRRSSERSSDISVEAGVAFGNATYDGKVLPYADYISKYEARVTKSLRETFPAIANVSVEVILRAANLTHNGLEEDIPTRREIRNLDGMSSKTIGDTVFRDVLKKLQQDAGFTPTREGNGGSRKGAGRKAKGNKATKGGKPVPGAVQAANSANSAPAVPPTVDVKKAREDAAASLMGGAKEGDLLLAALQKNRKAVITYLTSLVKS